ncbi:hypothetical protein LTR56_007732 [Elasticomyces elasticus]|nr:hypothetical protein LTR56_007732 [Elasticomyces elasticus]KAK3661896.1 hypothetical protein LTR22_007270 [Elasticomyces elasticus]KAK4925591.1 hypothetical protein LTR49_007429 [Elasticomyces elasticus]KAK5759869.1 hypothetical protein LTS12_010056 [Elasticomyces elasticus]
MSWFAGYLRYHYTMMRACKMYEAGLAACIPHSVIATVITACVSEMWNEQRSQSSRAEHAALLAGMICAFPESARTPMQRTILMAAVQMIGTNRSGPPQQPVWHSPPRAQSHQHGPSQPQQQLQSQQTPPQPSTNTVAADPPGPVSTAYGSLNNFHGLPVPISIAQSGSSVPGRLQHPSTFPSQVVGTGPGVQKGQSAPPSYQTTPVLRDAVAATPSTQFAPHADDGDVTFVSANPVSGSGGIWAAPVSGPGSRAVPAGAAVTDSISSLNQQNVSSTPGASMTAIRSGGEDQWRDDFGRLRKHEAFTKDESLRLAASVHNGRTAVADLTEALPGRKIDSIRAHMKTDKWKACFEEYSKEQRTIEEE